MRIVILGPKPHGRHACRRHSDCSLCSSLQQLSRQSTCAGAAGGAQPVGERARPAAARCRRRGRRRRSAQGGERLRFLAVCSAGAAS